MTEYIKREAATVYAPLPKELREYQTGNLDDAFEYGYDFAIGQIEAIPSADVVELELSPVCYKCDGKTADGVRTEKCLWLNGDNSKCIEQAHKLLYLAKRGE